MTSNAPRISRKSVRIFTCTVWSTCLLVALAAALAPALGAVASGSDQESPKILVVPEGANGFSLQERKEAQFASLAAMKIFYSFGFENRIAESGIRFRHQIVDDAGKHYKAVHYDHGNGVTVADVDADGRYDIYFLTQMGSNQLWRNLGQGKFQDITESAGVGLADRISVAASFGDIDNDGDADLFVTTVRMGNVLFENDGEGHFQQISKAAGVDYSGHSSGAVFFDYNRDGRLDLFVANVGTYTINERGRGGYYVGIEKAFQGHQYPGRAESSILYKNVGGTRFSDTSLETGLVDRGWSGDATAADVNEDGYVDLYVLNMQGADHFYENVEGREFVDRTSQYFPQTPYGTMGVKFFDYNLDGRLDLCLTDMHSDMRVHWPSPKQEKLKTPKHDDQHYVHGYYNKVFGNAFYKNEGGGKFLEVSDELGAENYWPWGLSVDDLNADGYADMFITSSMNYPFRYAVNSLLLNNAGEKFVDSEYLLGVEPRKSGRTLVDWFELDCAGEDEGHKHCGEEKGRVMVRAALGTRSSAIFDLDNDGDLDIVTNEFNSAPQILVSNLSEKTEIHFLKIKLVGKESNRDGLGALVRVEVGERTLTTVYDGKSGYLSQSSLPLYFGLGEEKKIDRIQVDWPSGRKQVITESIPLNTLFEIMEE